MTLERGRASYCPGAELPTHATAGLIGRPPRPGEPSPGLTGTSLSQLCFKSPHRLVSPSARGSPGCRHGPSAALTAPTRRRLSRGVCVWSGTGVHRKRTLNTPLERGKLGGLRKDVLPESGLTQNGSTWTKQGKSIRKAQERGRAAGVAGRADGSKG